MLRRKDSTVGTCAVLRRVSAAAAVGGLLFVAQPGGHAQTSRPPLKFFKNYFLSGGDYAVGGIGIRGTGNPSTGFATGTISMSGVPANADISAALLYWASLESQDSIEPVSAEGFFRGAPISGKEINAPNVPGCRGAGGGSGTTQGASRLRVYRADVLRHLPISTNPATLGKVLVNNTDLTANGQALHQVRLRDSGAGGTQSPSTGNQVTYTEGATLVVVYRVATAPLRAVVIYDGGVTVDQDFTSMSLTVGGYYDASATPGARMTHMVANGRNRPETLSINGAVVGGSNPLSGTLGDAWDNFTHNISGAISDTGVPTGVTFPTSSIDCLSWAGIVLSTGVQDTDGDGIPDKVEDADFVNGPGLSDPNGQALPDLKSMGASSRARDLFVEIGFMFTDATHNPWPAASGVGLHSHLPSAKALEMVGEGVQESADRES